MNQCAFPDCKYAAIVCGKCGKGTCETHMVWDGVIPIEQPRKSNYIGAPACFKLEVCCRQLMEAFDEDYGIYQVGSSLYKSDWRDVDLRYILDDEAFKKLFPQAGQHWEFDPRWLLLVNLISDWLSAQTGLPVDFQFQPQTYANERYSNKDGKHIRNAMGLRIKD